MVIKMNFKEIWREYTIANTYRIASKVKLKELNSEREKAFDDYIKWEDTYKEASKRLDEYKSKLDYDKLRERIIEYAEKELSIWFDYLKDNLFNATKDDIFTLANCLDFIDMDNYIKGE